MATKKRDSKGHFVKDSIEFKGLPNDLKKEESSVATEEKRTKAELEKEIDDRISANVTIKNLSGVIRHPDIRAGVCEFCGTHWTKCVCKEGNYHSMDVACTFCRKKEMTDYRKLEVFSTENSPNVYVFLCSDQRCIKKCANQFLEKN